MSARKTTKFCFMDLKIEIIRDKFSSYLNQEIIHENKIRENERNYFPNKPRNIYFSSSRSSKIFNP